MLPYCGVGDVLPLLLEKWSAGLSCRAMAILSRFCAIPSTNVYYFLSIIQRITKNLLCEYHIFLTKSNGVLCALTNFVFKLYTVSAICEQNGAITFSTAEKSQEKIGKG